MNDTIEMVQEFHDKFRVDVECVDIPKLRIKLLREELDELEAALKENNKVEIIDALTDLQYVLDGAYIALGMKKYKLAAFKEVHRSNMSKLDEKGNPIYREDGKILKGKNYSPPDLASIIKEQPHLSSD